MKRSLFLALILAACTFNASAAITVSGTEGTYIYNGNDYIATNTSSTTTTTTVTFNLDKAIEYVKSASYDSSSYLLGWNSNVGSSYGLTVVSDGSGGVKITASIFGEIWSNTTNNSVISYDTLKGLKDAEGNVTLTITNTSGNGVTASYGSTSTTWTGLQYSSYATTYGYRTNDAYVNSVVLSTTGSAISSNYTTAYTSQRADSPSVGRILFAGDSITHGINEATWRWQLYKTLTDSGIENEIAAPCTGFEPNFPTSVTSDATGNEATYEYGGTTYNNEHLAKASGRVPDMLAGVKVQGATYGGGQNSAANTTTVYNYDTVVCLMGTNDLLSQSGYTSSDYITKMTTLLGGSATFDDTTKKYSWTCTSSGNWGNMGKLAADMLPDKEDAMYLMTVPVFTIHTNADKYDEDGYSEIRNAVPQYNEFYKSWAQAYNKAHGTNIKVIEINRGLVDVTKSEFYGHEQFFRLDTGGDGIHPSEQGSLIIAGNVAQGMGIGGRTAGLERADASTAGTSWQVAESVIGLSAGQSQMLGENSFTMEDGYTVDFSAVFGDGAANDWDVTAGHGVNISIGDGTNSGTLTLTEGYIMWGDKVLFCQDNSLTGNDGLRVAWHNGSTEDNVLQGYYVWLGDMLIGQGLEASEGANLNGILLTAAGGEAVISKLLYTNTAYAPTTTGSYSATYAYMCSQDTAAVSGAVSNIISSGVDFTDATSKSADGSALVSSIPSSDTGTLNFKLDSAGTSYVFLSSCGYTGEVNAQVTAETKYTIFGTKAGASDGILTVQVDAGANVNTGNGNYGFDDNQDGQNEQFYAAIAGSFGGGAAEEFKVYVNGGTVNGNIVGGSINGTGKIKSTSIVVNGGTVTGDIVAGALVTREAAMVDSGDIVITGGTIQGSISRGNVGTSTVTVLGNSAAISGGIEADKVALRNVSSGDSDTGFDKYSGTIKTDTLVLDNAVMKKATVRGLTLETTMESVSILNGSDVELNTGDELEVDTLEIGGDTTLGLFISADDHTIFTETETTVTITGTLRVGGAGATLNANLVMGNDTVLDLAGHSLQLGSSLTLGGVQLDNVTIASVAALEVGDSLTLFTGVDELVVGGASYTGAYEAAASVAFANIELASGYQLVYSGAVNGGSVSILSIPEPTTSMLGLVGLVALTFRRRRK